VTPARRSRSPLEQTYRIGDAHGTTLFAIYAVLVLVGVARA
jgi:hypothetical protein